MTPEEYQEGIVERADAVLSRVDSLTALFVAVAFFVLIYVGIGIVRRFRS